VLQCVAACCSVLQCVAAAYHMNKSHHAGASRCRVFAFCCSVLQCVAVCCSVLQCVAVCCSVFAVRCSGISYEQVVSCRSVSLPSVCSVLQSVAVCLQRGCSVLQRQNI